MVHKGPQLANVNLYVLVVQTLKRATTPVKRKNVRSQSYHSQNEPYSTQIEPHPSLTVPTEPCKPYSSTFQGLYNYMK